MNNNLFDLLKFVKFNKHFSDFNSTNQFLSTLNFSKFKFNNNLKNFTGGSLPNQPSYEITQPDIMQPNMDNLIQPNMVDLTQPVVSDLTQPVVSDLTQPVSDLTQPVVSDLTQPVVNDLTQPVVSDLTQPVVSDLTQQDIINTNFLPEITINENNLTQSANQTNCVYKNIKNEDGSYITQKICGKEIITMPDIFLQKPSFINSNMNTYTIKKGTILYHATTQKRGFDTNEIRLGKDKLISFFTPNFRLATDKIEGCSIDKQKGFIHFFEVKTDITDIFIKLPYDTDENLNLDELNDKFCNNNQYYKGVGFFYPKNEIEIFNNSVLNEKTEDEINDDLDNETYYSEFALCSPSNYLNYLYSQKCMSLRKLSTPYRFDGKNFN